MVKLPNGKFASIRQQVKALRTTKQFIREWVHVCPNCGKLETHLIMQDEDSEVSVCPNCGIQV